MTSGLCDGCTRAAGEALVGAGQEHRECLRYSRFGGVGERAVRCTTRISKGRD